MPPDAEFAALTEPFRPELLAHCYRLLGSIHDAEDLVQETYLRAWRGFDRFEGRSSVRRWLYRIATMACLTALETRARRPLPSGLGTPAADYRAAAAAREPAAAWLQPAPEPAGGSGDPAAIVAGRSGVRLAFIAALQYLSARQRAVLTLRDVLAFPAAEVAEILDTSVAAVDSALRRARIRLAEAQPVDDADLAEPDEKAVRVLLDDYIDAFTRADAGALVKLLRAEVELEMPPIPTWFSGRAAVVGFLAGHVLHADRWRMTPSRANGQPALVVHRRVADGRFAAYGVQVLTLAPQAPAGPPSSPEIVRITSFNDPELVPTFGFAAVLVD